MKLSIIIPVYNGSETIGRCLDSVYSQGLAEYEYEVICVDDCSPDPSSITAIEKYRYKNIRPSNLKLVKHEVNKRQGGARNTGIRIAKGQWILFIDQDDFFVDNSIVALLNAAYANSHIDFIMFDCVTGDGIEIKNNGTYSMLDQSIMTGTKFLQNQPVPWCPWCYLYNTQFLSNSGCRFAENVRFEDADFVLKVTAKARWTRFLPIILVYHTEHPSQTTQIGNDKRRIGDFFKMNYRMAIAAKEIYNDNRDASKAIMKHVAFMKRSAILRYLWRLPYHDIREVLNDCQFQMPSGSCFVDFSNNYTILTAVILTTLKPFFHIASKIKFLYKAFNYHTH